MYRAVKRVLERQAARVLYQAEARQTLPPVQEWRRFDAADVQPGAVLVRGPAQGAAPAHGRRREPQGGHQQPGAVLRAEAEAGREDPRAARKPARDLPEAAQGEAGSARRGGEAEDLAAQDGKCALCGCGLTAGACELDHVVPVRQAFAGSVQTLQALCGDCRSEKTRERGVRRHGVRPEPQAAPSGF